MDFTTAPPLGDVDIAEIGLLLSDRTRCRVLMALNDGRALAASVLADEAGVTRSTASWHLAKLTDAGLLRVENHGRHRYYRLAGPHVGDLLEKLTQIAPAQPVRSLREGNRSARLRAARTCYDHLAGRLGVGIMARLLETGRLIGGDGTYDRAAAALDHPSGYGRDLRYEVTPAGWALFDRMGLVVPDGTRNLVRYCVDWSEQRHHLAGRLGSALLDHFVTGRWIERSDVGRSVRVTRAGEAALTRFFDLDWD